MATALELPQFGNTVEECLITKWVKRTGDSVASGDVVAEIETDKTTFEVTAPVAGTVLEIFFEEGALVPVFTNLCVIGTVGESVEAFRPESATVTIVADAGLKPCATASLSKATSSADAATAPAGAFSPRARKFAAEHDFRPSAIAGSGPGGRVLEQDVRREYARSQPRAGLISNVRDTIARRMRESLASTAQYTLHASAGAAGLLALRARIKERRGMADININDLVTFCTIRALGEMPDLNAEFIGGRIVRHSGVHIGFACDTPRGLLVPVVRHADGLAIAELSLRMKALATRAVEGTIAPDEMRGATFTISNLGGLGIEAFTPVINPPQVAILGVGSIELKPVRRRGTVEFVDAIGLSLTCDHQVIDGAPGARFLHVLKNTIEGVESICTI